MSINGVDADEALSIAKDGGTLTINTKDTDLLALEDLGFNEIERRANWEDDAFSVLSDQGLNAEEISRVLYEDEDYSMIKYWRGIDEYLYKETECQLYERTCWSFMYSTEEMHYPVCLFNHNFHNMIKKIPWTQKYILQEIS